MKRNILLITLFCLNSHVSAMILPSHKKKLTIRIGNQILNNHDQISLNQNQKNFLRDIAPKKMLLNNNEHTTLKALPDNIKTLLKEQNFKFYYCNTSRIKALQNIPYGFILKKNCDPKSLLQIFFFTALFYLHPASTLPTTTALFCSSSIYIPSFFHIWKDYRKNLDPVQVKF